MSELTALKPQADATADTKMLSHIRYLLQAGQYHQSFNFAKALVKAKPLCAEHWLVLSEVLSNPSLAGTGKPLVAANRAVQLAPENIACLTQQANCLVDDGEFKKAQSIAEKALALNPADAFIYDKLGLIFNRCGELTTAYQCFKKATELQPKTTHFLFNLAALQRAMGLTDEARQSFTAVIACEPDNSSAYLARSGLYKASDELNAVNELKQALAKAKHPHSKVKLNFALAKELEDMQQYQNSFSYLQAGNDIRKQHMDYQVANDVQAMEAITNSFSPKNYSAITAGFDTEEPIFIIGLPRTGTTLLERIITSHTEVFSAGELQNFSINLVKQAQQKLGQGLNRSDLIKQSVNLDYDALGRCYLESTRPRTGSHKHFVDKLPLNFLYAGLIHKALPEAKIIHLTRSPMDACYAIYKTLFEQAYPFSYQLSDLAQYYLAYRRLMDHWQTLLGDNLYHVAYEDLVNQQEQTSRALIDYCRLDWQPECLHFEKNSAPTSTASATQVREGIYKSSVAKWRNYEQQLQPLQQAIEEGGYNAVSW